MGKLDQYDNHEEMLVISRPIISMQTIILARFGHSGQGPGALQAGGERGAEAAAGV
jgi:hypothetical protein